MVKMQTLYEPRTTRNTTTSTFYSGNLERYLCLAHRASGQNDNIMGLLVGLINAKNNLQTCKSAPVPRAKTPNLKITSEEL